MTTLMSPDDRLSTIDIRVDYLRPGKAKRLLCERFRDAGRGAFARSRFFLKVQDGCNHRCTYCIVWRTRGESRSGEEETLLERARQAVAQGYGEIVLTGVDLGSFGRERGGAFAPFVSRMLEAIAPAAESAFSGMHVFRYSPRAGTAAPRLGPPAADPVSQARSYRLKEQAETQRRSYEAGFINRSLEVLWDRRFPNRVRGLSDNYISVYAPPREQRLGTLATVLPLAATDDGLLVS